MPSLSLRWTTLSLLGLLLAGPLACSDEGRTEPCLATEDCFNGLDDDCDRLADCEDPDCSAGAVCVPAAAGFALGTAVDADVACPAPFPGDGLLLGQGLVPGAACEGCACGTPVVDCWLQLSTFPLANCGIGSVAYARTVSATRCSAGPPGWNSFSDATLGLNYWGRCTPSGTPAPPPLAWAQRARFCEGPRGGGCTAGAACVPRAASQCVVAAGEAGCPAPYAPVGSEPWFTGAADGRGCPDQCTCEFPAGGSCGPAVVRTYASADCTGPSSTMGFDVCVNGRIGSAVLELTGTVVPGACAPSGGALEGSATPTGPHTLCCLP
jgi:hypothetical protein